MDSPFLSNKPLDDDDGTLVLADLSIQDEDSFDVPLHARAPRPAPSTSSASVSRPPAVAPPSVAAPSRTKPRFSLFAPGAAETPASSSTLRSTNTQRGFESISEKSERPVDPPSERSERSVPSSSHRTHDSTSEPRRTYAWDETVDEQPEEAPQAEQGAETSESREESLKSSLAELRRINTVFDSFLGALEQSREHNQRLAGRVAETSALLDDYVKLLGQAEHTRQLVMNEKWTGAEDDAAALQAEADRRAAREAAEEARRAAEAEEAARREREREAAAQREAAAKAKAAARPGVGTGRTGLRRGVPRGRGSSIPAPSRSRPTSAAGASATASGHVRPTSTTGLRRPTSGLGGRYANVPSSGYGR